MTLKAVIALAFHLPSWQISFSSAGPESKWIEKDEFDIEAKPSESSRSSIKDLRYSWMYGIEDENLREMLRALVVERFQLRLHRQTKTSKVWFLETSGKALRLRPTQTTADPSVPTFSGNIGFAGGQWVLSRTSMPQLAEFAADYLLHVPVLDRTGLTGSFDYRQPTLPDSEVNYNDPSDSFLRLIAELGLKLEPSTGEMEILVIDHVEKPSPN